MVDKNITGCYINYTITLQIKPMQPRWLKLHQRWAMVFEAADIYSEGGDASSEPRDVKESLRDVIYINNSSLCRWLQKDED